MKAEGQSQKMLAQESSRATVPTRIAATETLRLEERLRSRIPNHGLVCSVMRSEHFDECFPRGTSR